MHCDKCENRLVYSRIQKVWHCPIEGCPDYGKSFPAKLCTQCGRLLHEDGFRKDDDFDEEIEPLRCICCGDDYGHGETPEGKPIDWDNLPCCPKCGSFDVALEARVQTKTLAKYSPNGNLIDTHRTSETQVPSLVGGSGLCDSCGHMWGPGDGCLGRDFGDPRKTYSVTVIAQQQMYVQFEVKARGVEDAQDEALKLAKGAAWQEDDSEPDNYEVTEVLDNELNDLMEHPAPLEVVDGSKVILPGGEVVRIVPGGAVQVVLFAEDTKDGPVAGSVNLTLEILKAIDTIREVTQ